MKPSTAMKSIQAAVAGQLPLFLWGAPGVGKSALVKQAADELYGDRVYYTNGNSKRDAYFRDVRVLLLDPVDLRGLPNLGADGRAHWAPAEFLPEDGEGVLFLDELNAAPGAVQAACYQLLLDRSLGEYRLPDGWAMIAAGNRAEDRAVVNRMSTALGSRMIHIDIEPDLDDWTLWAGKAGIDPRVIAFCRFKPDVLMAFEPSASDRTFPCPRTWEYVSRLLATNPPAEALAPMLAGTVGEGAAAEFGAFLKVAGKVPSFDKILAAPARAPVPEGMDALHVVSAAIGARASAQNLDAVTEYAERMPVEFAMAGLRMAANRDPDVCDTHAWQQWAARNADALI